MTVAEIGNIGTPPLIVFLIAFFNCFLIVSEGEELLLRAKRFENF